MYLIAKSNTQSSIAVIAFALAITCISHAIENWRHLWHGPFKRVQLHEVKEFKKGGYFYFLFLLVLFVELKASKFSFSGPSCRMVQRWESWIPIHRNLVINSSRVTGLHRYHLLISAPWLKRDCQMEPLFKKS